MAIWFWETLVDWTPTACQCCAYCDPGYDTWANGKQEVEGECGGKRWRVEWQRRMDWIGQRNFGSAPPLARVGGPDTKEQDLILTGEKKKIRGGWKQNQWLFNMVAADQFANFSSDSNISTKWNTQLDKPELFGKLNKSTDTDKNSFPETDFSHKLEEPFVISNGKVSCVQFLSLWILAWLDGYQWCSIVQPMVVHKIKPKKFS